jgi:hypothetical protein
VGGYYRRDCVFDAMSESVGNILCKNNAKSRFRGQSRLPGTAFPFCLIFFIISCNESFPSIVIIYKETISREGYALFAELISNRTLVRVYVEATQSNPIEGVISGYNPTKAFIKLNDDTLIFPIRQVFKIEIVDEVPPVMSMRCPYKADTH